VVLVINLVDDCSFLVLLRLLESDDVYVSNEVVIGWAEVFGM
jgi:hypothetical protein